MATRSEQKQRRRNQILVSALDLFIQKGFADTKIVDIAQAVDMSTGLLFHYFESKERLYEELVRMGLEKSQTLLAANQDDPLLFFEGAASTILGNARRDPYVAKMFVLMSQAADNALLPQESRNYIKRDVFHQSARIIRAGQKTGTIRAGDPVALAVAFWGTIQGICHLIALEPDLPCPDGDWVVDILRNRQNSGSPAASPQNGE